MQEESYQTFDLYATTPAIKTISEGLAPLYGNQIVEARSK